MVLTPVTTGRDEGVKGEVRRRGWNSGSLNLLSGRGWQQPGQHSPIISNRGALGPVIFGPPPPLPGGVTLSPSALSRPMQRKLVTLVNCQLVEEEGRVRAVRAGRSLGERTVTELILQHQNPQQLSANLWAAVRARGCQFLGPGKTPDTRPV